MTWILNALFLFFFPLTEQLDHSSKAFQSLKEREGTYHLVQGTQGCPKEVLWEATCQGVVLFNLDDHSGIPFRNEFCDINKKPKILRQKVMNEVQVVEVKVSTSENYIKKQEEFFYKAFGQPLKTEANQVLILDPQKAFMWERDYMGMGTSCLYRH